MKLVIPVLVIAAVRSAAADVPPRVIERPCRVASIEVASPGAPAQRGQLRYALRPGAHARGRIELDETVWGARYPRVTLDVASEVTAVEADGHFHFREVITGVTLESTGSDSDIDIPAMRRAYEDAIGLTGETTFDARGNCSVRRIVVARPAIDRRVLDDVDDHVGNLTWLPSEPVGVGSKWRTTTTQIDDDGRTVAHTYTTVLLARRGNLIEIEQTSSSSGGAQPEENGLVVTSATATSKYRASFELDRLAWSWTFANTARYKAVLNGVPQEVERVRSSHGAASP